MKARVTRPISQLKLTAAPALPGAANAEDSRSLILREALALFAQKGYGATTVRDIAANVGMLAGSLYSHFSSKEQMLAELVHLGHVEHSKRLRSAVLASPLGPRNQLVAMVRAIVLFHVEYRTLAIVSNAEVHVLDPELAKPSMDLRDQSVQLLKDILERGLQLKEFQFHDLTLTMTVIASLGARVANWYTPDFHLSADEVADQIAGIACRIVGTP